MPAGQRIGEHEGVTLAGLSKQAIDFTHHAIHVLTLAYKLPNGSVTMIAGFEVENP